MMDIDKIFNTIIKTGLCCYGFKTFRVFICISVYKAENSSGFEKWID